MVDTLLLRLSLHFTTLVDTSLFPSKLHPTTLHYLLIWLNLFKFPTAPFALIS